MIGQIIIDKLISFDKKCLKIAASSIHGSSQNEARVIFEKDNDYQLNNNTFTTYITDQFKRSWKQNNKAQLTLPRNSLTWTQQSIGKKKKKVQPQSTTFDIRDIHIVLFDTVYRDHIS